MAQEIKNLIPSILHGDQNWKFKLLSNWHAIFGPLSTRVSLEKIHDDILILGVQDSCWLQELYLLSTVLLKTINETLDQPRIKNLRFKIIGNKKKKQPQQLKQKVWSKHAVTLTTVEDNALHKIQDPQLRDALKNFLIRCHQEKV
ncbi:MAG: DciA family protein [Candidatus Dependentiae bacterium]|nr:DciA family protein [Candidatus Dependentiae bacterium]